MRFIDADTLTLSTEEITIPTWEWEGWMVYDNYLHQAYVPATQIRWTTSNVSWKEVQAHVVAGRAYLGSFSVNDSFNTDPLNPEDPRYTINGLAFKEPFSEGNNPGRLLVDDVSGGNVDVVDLDAAGTGAVRRQRYSYRDSISGAVQTNQGNSLALETRHETLPSDDLHSTDTLYIADRNREWVDGYGYIYAVQLSHPLRDLNASPLPDVDLNDTWPFMNGLQGIAMAGTRDVLYVASGLQSFDDGYVAEVNTTQNQLAQVVTLTYADEGFVHVDWYDSRRVFVVTFDGFYNDPHQGLYLHLIYEGAVVDTLRLLDNYDSYGEARGMAFDPYHRRLYLTVGGSVMVFQVNYGADPAPMLVRGSGVIEPQGGSLAVPCGRALLDCPAGAVNQPVVVSYAETDGFPTGGFYGVRSFDITAVISGTDTPVTSFIQPCNLTVSYTDEEKGAAAESTLALYRWQGSLWEREASSSVDPANNQVSADIDGTGRFGVLGESERIFLPLLLKGL